jgi:hypothetical protein
VNDLAVETARHFVPLRIAGEAPALTVAESSELAEPHPSRDRATGSIELEIGRARVRVEGVGDLERLADDSGHTVQTRLAGNGSSGHFRIH